MVMPRSRSRSIASSTCASISRACRAPVSSRKRSASVDLPWSMCAMTEKFRMRSALLKGNVALRIRGADVLRPRTNQAVVRVLLQHVRRPARDAAHRENRGEQVDADAERVISRRRIEVDVRVQLLFGLDEALDPLRHLEPDRLAGALAEIARHLAQVRRARILGVIHAVAEAR